ncbi:MAG: hypothetical protein ACTS3F_09110 [Phycisphaerales bacterium]
MWQNNGDLTNASPTAAIRNAVARFMNETGPRNEDDRVNSDEYWQLAAMAFFAARLTRTARQPNGQPRDAIPANVERFLRDFLGNHGLDRIKGGTRVNDGWDDTPPDIMQWVDRSVRSSTTN